MRSEGALLGLPPQRSHLFLHSFLQFPEALLRILQSDPDDAGPAQIGKTSEAFQM